MIIGNDRIIMPVLKTVQGMTGGVNSINLKFPYVFKKYFTEFEQGWIIVNIQD